MQYAMFVVVDPDGEAYVEEEDDAAAWDADLEERGIMLARQRLRPADEATTIRVRDGRTLITDGPFTESKEWIAGFAVLRCADLDEAIALAATHAMARFGRVEVRALCAPDGSPIE